MANYSEGFLTQVLRTYENIQIGTHLTMIEEVALKISNLKFQVKEMIEKTYVDFTLLPQEHRQMVTDSEALSNEMYNLTYTINADIKENLRHSTGELKDLSNHLQEVTISLNIVNQLVSLDEAFKLACKLQDNNEHCEVAKTLLRANKILSEAREHNQDVEIFEALADESTQISGVFLEDMMKVWGECLQFREASPENQSNLSSCTLLVDVTRNEEIEQMFQALNIFDHLDMYFEKFASRIYKSMLLPVILQGATVKTDIDETEKFMFLTVSVDLSAKKSSYKDVFENLRKCFNFIRLNLKVDIDVALALTFKLGSIISEDLVNDLVEHCLADTIPCHSTKLDEFNTVITETGGFEAYLKAIGLLDKDNVTLHDYTKNVEYLCANKTCRTLLEKARTIMKKDLYDMTEVNVEASSTSSEMTCGTHLEPSVKVKTNMYEFPKCKISKSAVELLDVINQILADCATSTDLCAVRLFYTARNIVELYCAIVPIHHEKMLETIPQQAALFHNNCMYLSHSLMTLGYMERSKLPEVLHSHMTTFVDQTSDLRSSGTSVFLTHMKMQRDQILDIIRNSELAAMREKRSVTPESEKTVRQCLRQLELLKTVWHNVLPENVYCKAIGSLVNSFVEELISRVISVEDIPADMAAQLGQIFTVVTSRAPALFPEPKVVHRFVLKWTQFLELIIILAASMKEITDRWASGKGPLACLFPADQVRQLIRALFQNTNRRATVLAGIKDTRHA